MPDPDAGERAARAVPSMLDLVRLSPRPLFPPGGVELSRQIALLTDLGAGHEVLDVACGKGISLEYFVREHGVHGSGVDEDPELVRQAEERSRDAELADRMQFQVAPSDGLPYRDEIFDVAVGELGLAAHCDPGAAVGELVRVTKPGGSVVLVQLVWKAPLDGRRAAVLTEHLGARPLMLVEWRRLLRDAGLVEIHTEDWADEDTAFRSRAVKPFPDFAEIFSLGEKIDILRRAWGRWGWRGVRSVLAREREVHRLLARERIIGLDLVKGRRPTEAEARGGGPEGARPGRPERDQGPVPRATPSGPAATAAPAGPATDSDAETTGLPLFGEEDS